MEDFYISEINKCKTSVEWGFRQVLSLFPYTDSTGFKRLGATPTEQHYINATFMMMMMVMVVMMIVMIMLTTVTVAS